MKNVAWFGIFSPSIETIPLPTWICLMSNMLCQFVLSLVCTDCVQVYVVVLVLGCNSIGQ